MPSVVTCQLELQLSERLEDPTWLTHMPGTLVLADGLRHSVWLLTTNAA